jgi:HPt (histidine-containing phosphotransfer) domain-containing protein
VAIDSLPARRLDVAESVKAGNLDQARIHVHGVKGAANGLGLRNFARCSADLENALRNEESDKIPDLHRRWERRLDQTISALRSALVGFERNGDGD